VTNLAARSSLALQSEAAAREFKSPYSGLVLIKIPDLAGPGKPAWVGRCEVTQAEYEKVMGKDVNQSTFKGTNLPVQNVTWVEANDFCERLTRAETTRPRGLTGNTNCPPSNNGRISPPAPTSRRRVPGGPAGARRTRGLPNKFGLADVFGNVWEWLSVTNQNPTTKAYIGGGFRSNTSMGEKRFLDPGKPADEPALRCRGLPGDLDAEIAVFRSRASGAKFLALDPRRPLEHRRACVFFMDHSSPLKKTA